MEIEMRAMGASASLLLQGEPGEGGGVEDDEQSLIDSLGDFLNSPISGDTVLADEVIDRRQKKRLRRLFDASDRGQKGYLTHDELSNLFGKLRAVLPHSFLTHISTDAATITWPQFLNIFAIAKGSQQSIFRRSKKLTLPERFGTYLLQTMSKSQAVKKVRTTSSAATNPLISNDGDYDYEEYADGTKIVLVNPREQRNLAWTKIGAMYRAAFIGAFFAALVGVIELVAGHRWNYSGDISLRFAVPYSNVALFWTVVVIANVMATLFEILLLYVDSLRAASLISGYLGLDPWLMGYVNDMEHATTAIVRAAFELPHPSDQILGIRPLRYSNRVNGFFKALLWKSKRGLTAMMLGMFLRRLIPRATMKIASPFVSVPIAALWNLLVAWRVISAISSIVIGNIAIARVVTKVVEPRYRYLSDPAKKLVYCVAGVEIALEQQIHPILETLLRTLCRLYGNPPPDLPIDDKFYLRNQLRDIPREEQLLILQLQAVAIVSNSHISLTAMRYLKETLLACDLNPDEEGIDELRKQLSSKSFINVEHITDLFRDSVMKDHSRSCWASFAMWMKVASYNFAY